jgi:hypothetical protein
VKAPSATDPNAPKVPKSFVVKSGTVGGSVAQLTKDVRKVLEPNTATRLKERKANRLRDYVSMSGPLGVTHLAVFSQPPTSNATIPSETIANETAEQRAERSLVEGTTTVNLRLIRLPRGPTLSFKVLRYSLASDVLRMARRPRAVGREFAEAPLVTPFLHFSSLTVTLELTLKHPTARQLILSGFGGEDKQLKLMTTVFQNLFPPIHVQTVSSGGLGTVTPETLFSIRFESSRVESRPKNTLDTEPLPKKTDTRAPVRTPTDGPLLGAPRRPPLVQLDHPHRRFPPLRDPSPPRRRLETDPETDRGFDQQQGRVAIRSGSRERRERGFGS